MAVVNNRPVRLAGQRHVFDVLFSAVWRTERADHSGCVVEVGLLDEGFNHLIAPAGVRLNDLLDAAGFALRLLRTVFPPLLRGVTWSTSLPSPL